MFPDSSISTDELATLAVEAEKKKPEERTEEEKLAILGKPRLGDVVRAQIRIKESKEFKVSRHGLSLYALNTPIDQVRRCRTSLMQLNKIFNTIK